MSEYKSELKWDALVGLLQQWRRSSDSARLPLEPEIDALVERRPELIAGKLRLFFERRFGYRFPSDTSILQAVGARLTRSELAGHLGVTTRTLANWDRQGRVPKIGAKWEPGMKRGGNLVEYVLTVGRLEAINRYLDAKRR